MKRKPYFKNEKLAPFLNIKPEFKAEVKGDEATLYIYGDIGDSWWGESVSAADVRDYLKDTDASTIHVRLNTLGGDVFDGLAIHNQLKGHAAKIIIHIDGIAASAGSIIAMSGDEILMPKTSMMMIHNAWTFTYGNSNELRKVAADLDKINDTIIESYLPRFVGTREELVQLLDDETFLTANEAITFGLADVEVDEAAQPEEPVLNTLLAKYAAKAKPKSDEPKNLLNQFKRNSNE
ncbi:Clp protease ClpP [Sporosarcina saromensis]|uniref:ATP-dependent Clp protease proteolytic subunit n=1 Tax=Sporosarcina saromensis TaxID=359365 RepID=A0ABU4G5G7_9BACL|nr:head maturation protease, ClpP-related [Sporosarcina saromensis]MDW0112213.1 Clp protease ClpP [Sporosarcina saromensis]